MYTNSVGRRYIHTLFVRICVVLFFFFSLFQKYIYIVYINIYVMINKLGIHNMDDTDAVCTAQSNRHLTNYFYPRTPQQTTAPEASYRRREYNKWHTLYYPINIGTIHKPFFSIFRSVRRQIAALRVSSEKNYAYFLHTMFIYV